MWLFEVTRTTVGELVVLAEDERSARRLAACNAEEIVSADSDDVRADLVHEVEGPHHVPAEWRDHPPIQERYDPPPGKGTCLEIAERIERELPLHKQPGFKATKDLFAERR